VCGAEEKGQCKEDANRWNPTRKKWSGDRAATGGKPKGGRSAFIPVEGLKKEKKGSAAFEDGEGSARIVPLRGQFLPDPHKKKRKTVAKSDCRGERNENSEKKEPAILGSILSCPSMREEKKREGGTGNPYDLDAKTRRGKNGLKKRVYPRRYYFRLPTPRIKKKTEGKGRKIREIGFLWKKDRKKVVSSWYLHARPGKGRPRFFLAETAGSAQREKE